MKHKNDSRELPLTSEEIDKVIDSIPTPVFYKDGAGVYKSCNDAFCHFVGKSRDQVIGSAADQYGSQKTYHESDLDLIRQGGSRSDELQVTCHDGENRTIVMNRSVIINDHGDVLGLVGFIVDITRLKNVERKAEQFEKYQNMFDGSNAIMLLIDPATGKIADANRSAREYYGYSRDEILAMNISEINILSHEEVLNEMESARKYSRNYFSFRHRKKSGVIRDVEVYSSPVVLDDNDYLLSIIHDVTDRMVMETRIAQSEERFRAIFNTALLGIFLTNSKYEIIQFNDRLANMFNVSGNMLSGSNILDYVYADDHDNAARRVKELFLGKSRQSRVEVRFKKNGGTLFWGELSLSPVINAQGELESLAGTIMDISERKNYEDALLVAIQEADIARASAEKADRAKSMFLANISHEIRTPLNAVNGFSELLHNHVSGEEATTYLGGIKTASKNLLALINDILDLSRIEAGKLKIFETPENIPAICDEIRRLFLIRADEKGIGLELDVDENFPGRVVIDGIRIRQVLMNLVGNAIKFTHQGGITIHARVVLFHDNQQLDFSISVEDTGIGIPANEQESIFKSFQQTESQSPSYGGTGLGLAISRNLVQLMNGTLEVKSVEGKGSTFTITIQGVQYMETPESHLPGVSETGLYHLEGTGDKKDLTTTYGLPMVKDLDEKEVFLLQPILEREELQELLKGNQAFTMSSVKNAGTMLVEFGLSTGNELSQKLGEKLLSFSKTYDITGIEQITRYGRRLLERIDAHGE